jgi:pilus assembly protein CpaB
MRGSFMFANRNIWVLAIAAILGVAAVIIANSYLSGVEENQQRAAEEGRLVQIAVARVPLDYGAKLNAENVRMVSWPATSLPQGAFRSTKGLFDGDARVVLRPIEAGEPILPGKITGFGGRASIAELIETDMRAMAVRISDTTGVGGHIFPGDRVDVMVTRQPKLDGEQGEAEAITDIVIQNIRVAAIDLEPSDKKMKGPKVGKTATLVVDQQGAQKLALAGQVGTLSLALRHPANQDQFASQTVGTRDLGQGDRSQSLYAGAARNSGGSASQVPPAYYPAMAPTPRSTVPAAPRAPRVPGGVTVQIVRGTEATPYDVKRHRGY